MLYLDTSLLVTAMTPEPATGIVQDWLRDREAGETAISDWVIAEFSSALSVKLRSHKITHPQYYQALIEFRKLVADSLEVLPISSQHFRMAADFADGSGKGLRAGDALHLAVASAHRGILCTRDRRLAEAAAEFGVPVQFL